MRLIRVASLALFLSLPVWVLASVPKCSDFIRRSGSRLMCGDYPFYSIGVNSYFLQNIAAFDDTSGVIEIFEEAKALGVNTIRTWGFFDAPDSMNQAVIQSEPGIFNQRGLRALDYVVAKAREYSIRLIIPLVNNWEDYGGMNQYVRWYAERHPSLAREPAEVSQLTVKGVEGRSYRYLVAGGLTHDQFYILPDIKAWYKNYASALLMRENTITKVRYADEPYILAWELANEPRSSDPSGEIVARWADEMSAFIKSIDANHLLSTGEEGLDVSEAYYANLQEYNQQGWLFDGTGGVSFYRNSDLQYIDIASIHCYPASWHLTMDGGVRWLRDHQRIADAFDKPLILGEVGVKADKRYFYDILLNEGDLMNTSGCLIWQFVYDGRPDNDGYAIYYPKDEGVCGIIQKYAGRFERKRLGNSSLPISVSLENYPNPFNEVTVVSYSLHSSAIIRLEVYNTLGQRIEVLTEGLQPAGMHLSLFDARMLSAGTYFLRLWEDNVMATLKMSLIK